MKFTDEALENAKMILRKTPDVLEHLQSIENLKGSGCYHIGNGCWKYEAHCRGYIFKAIGNVITAITYIYEPHCCAYCKEKNVLLVCATDESVVYDGDTLKELCDANYD